MSDSDDYNDKDDDDNDDDVEDGLVNNWRGWHQRHNCSLNDHYVSMMMMIICSWSAKGEVSTRNIYVDSVFDDDDSDDSLGQQ